MVDGEYQTLYHRMGVRSRPASGIAQGFLMLHGSGNHEYQDDPRRNSIRDDAMTRRTIAAFRADSG
jgi:hypothetical protein